MRNPIKAKTLKRYDDIALSRSMQAAEVIQKIFLDNTLKVENRGKDRNSIVISD